MTIIKNDKWLYKMCKNVASNSKCLSRKVGSVLVRDGVVISQGYNGPPKGSPHCDERYIIDPVLRENMKNLGKDPDDPNFHKCCPRQSLGFKSGQGLDWCVAGHSERNALINAASNGISTKGTKLYMDCNVPCTPCLVEIINAGVEEIIIVDYKYYDISAEYTLKNSTLEHRLYRHLCKHERIVATFCINCKSNLNDKMEIIGNE